jgi:hypothetical protein
VELVQTSGDWYVLWVSLDSKAESVLSVADFLLKKWNEAQRMSKEMKESWLEFQSSLDPVQVSSWELLNTAPRFADGRWTSVYIMSESPGRFLFSMPGTPANHA